MEERNIGFRYILLLYFRKGKTATQSCEKLSKNYDDDALTEH